jgi:hypothetical protein
VAAGGYQPTHDAVLRIELSLGVTLGSVDVSPQPGDAGLSGSYVANFDVPATPAACGDLLRVDVTFLSGTSDFIEFSTSLEIP